MHPAIRPASLSRLGALVDRTADDMPHSNAEGWFKARVRRTGKVVVDRVGDRAAAALAGQVEQLREELDRTKRDLETQIEALRAELAAHGSSDS